MKLRYLVLIVLCAAAIQSCEDDPVLSPNTAKPKGGSYSKTSLPVVPGDSARNRTVVTNPELF